MGSQAAWLGKKVRDWVDEVSKVVVVLRRHPQAAYTVLKKSLQ